MSAGPAHLRVLAHPLRGQTSEADRACGTTDGEVEENRVLLRVSVGRATCAMRNGYTFLKQRQEPVDEHIV